MKYCVFLTLLFTVYGQEFLNPSEWEDTPHECGKTRFRDKEPQSTSDEKAATGQFPWVARIGYYWYREKTEMADKKEVEFVKFFRSGGAVRFTCGGSLVSKHYILSSAQCGLSAQVARVGENDVETDIDCDECDSECAPPHQDIKISRRLTAQECAVNRTNDVCILELKKSAELNDFVQPICIPRPPKGRSQNFLADAIIVGWATASATARRTTETEPVLGMMFTNGPVIAAKDCNKLFVRNIEDSQLCVGYPKSARTGCLGDFGGGLVVQKKVGKIEVSYVGGIATHAIANCFKDKITPIIYTEVSKVSDWVEKTIKQAASTRKADADEEEEETTEYGTSTSTENADDEIEDTTIAEDETDLVSNGTMARTNNATEDS